MIQFLLLLLLCRVQSAIANTEKVIFLSPSSLQIPIPHPTLEDLQLEALTPQLWSLRTHIQAEFPTNTSRYGQSSWYLLHGLQEGQRYEVRICWAATEPTSFRLDTYDLSTVFETPALITSLAEYSEGRQLDLGEVEMQEPSISKADLKSKRAFDDVSSTLFLHIQAAADFYTMNQTIMEHVPPVFVDIILDPFVFNILPRSLLPTVAYILVLAVGSWPISIYVNSWIRAFAGEDEDLLKKKT